MATALKNKFSIPAANTDTSVYTIPALTSFVLSTGSICNTNATAVTVQVYIDSLGLGTKYYEYHTLTIPPFETFKYTTGTVLVATDVLGVRASNTGVHFIFSGQENS